MQWTVIVAADDCTAVQGLTVDADSPESAAEYAHECGWLDDYHLVCVIEGNPPMHVADAPPEVAH
jgi:hypothetical protein